MAYIDALAKIADFGLLMELLHMSDDGSSTKYHEVSETYPLVNYIGMEDHMFLGANSGKSSTSGSFSIAICCSLLEGVGQNKTGTLWGPPLHCQAI